MIDEQYTVQIKLVNAGHPIIFSGPTQVAAPQKQSTGIAAGIAGALLGNLRFRMPRLPKPYPFNKGTMTVYSSSKKEYASSKKAKKEADEFAPKAETRPAAISLSHKKIEMQHKVAKVAKVKSLKLPEVIYMQPKKVVAEQAIKEATKKRVVVLLRNRKRQQSQIDRDLERYDQEQKLLNDIKAGKETPYSKPLVEKPVRQLQLSEKVKYEKIELFDLPKNPDTRRKKERATPKIDE